MREHAAMTTTQDAYEAGRAYIELVQAIGPGFHPDTRGQDYTSLPAGYTPERVEGIVLAAHRAGMDIYIWALAVLQGDLCEMCGQPTDLGDEPGHGFADNGAQVPLCSVACTADFYGVR